MISFAEKYPEFIKNFWDDEKNPKTLSYGSAKKIKCHCKEGCGNHRWETTPNQVAKVTYCPICSGKNVCPCGCNSLAKLNPEIVNIWDYERNEKNPNDYKPFSNKKVFWHCKKECGNHRWESKIDDVVGSAHKCPFCAISNGRVCPCGCNSLQKKFPQLVEQWDSNTREPCDIKVGSGYMANWKCNLGCGNHRWTTAVNRRTCPNGATNCPICVNQMACPCGCNTVFDNTVLIKYWDPKNIVDPKTVISGGSHKKYSWICKNGCGNHSWMSDPHHIKSGRRCPICAGKEICSCKCNALITTHPNIKHIWGINDFTMDQITHGSGKLANFYCKKHDYKWKTTVASVASGCGCSKCGSERTAEYQRFTKEEFIEKLFKKWGPNHFGINNTDYIAYNSNIILTCKKHGDFTTLPSRILSERVVFGCQKCAKSTYSKIAINWLKYESEIRNCTIQHAENGKEFSIPETKLKADGYCPETKTIFEFHGDYWHGNPNLYTPETINEINGKTMGELYTKTIEREKKIRKLGYELVVIWETEWKILSKNVSQPCFSIL